MVENSSAEKNGVVAAMTKLPRIDVHTHFVPRKVPHWAEKFSEEGYIHLEHFYCGAKSMARMLRSDGSLFREIKSNTWDLDERIAEANQTQVSKQVLSIIPVFFHYGMKAANALETSMYFNDQLAAAVLKYPDRFYGLGTVPLQDPQLAIKEMRRLKTDLGLQGIQIGSHIGKWNLSAAELKPVFAEAEKLDLAIFVHPWDMMGQDRMPEYFLPWLVGMPAETSLAICSLIFSGIFERYPKIRFGFAHGGGAFPFTLGRIDHGFQARPDLCAKHNAVKPSKYLKHFYVDSLVHDQDALKYLVNLFGSDRIFVGSDFPFPLGEDLPGDIIDRSEFLTGIDRENILSRSALSFLFGENHTKS